MKGVWPEWSQSVSPQDSRLRIRDFLHHFKELTIRWLNAWVEINPRVPQRGKRSAMMHCSGCEHMNSSSFCMCLCCVFAVPHRAPQLGTVGCVSNDVILRWRDAQEVEVIGTGWAGLGLQRVIAIQHPNVILAQEGVICRNTQTHTHPGN